MRMRCQGSLIVDTTSALRIQTVSRRLRKSQACWQNVSRPRPIDSHGTRRSGLDGVQKLTHACKYSNFHSCDSETRKLNFPFSPLTHAAEVSETRPSASPFCSVKVRQATIKVRSSLGNAHPAVTETGRHYRSRL